MTLSTSEAVRETYRLALQQEITRSLKTKPDWDRFLTIAKESRERIEAEQTAYRDEYTRRLADARAIVLRERTGLHYDQPKPPGAPDPLDKDNIYEAAHARVEQDHARRLNVIKDDELSQYQDLSADLQRRSQQKGRAHDAFTMASPTQTRNQQR